MSKSAAGGLSLHRTFLSSVSVECEVHADRLLYEDMMRAFDISFRGQFLAYL
jgi:hypothetical protein